ncbi:MAG TPA: hypothetical protein VNH82_09245 [Candidatus Dormibacteraeota bacterium]|nr:hypothetical protein [Candidatus Dormibacteraeota bacterium]
MTAIPPPPDSQRWPDPNLSTGGARQRKGPFWIDEPGWYWVLATLIFLLGAALFLVAVGFDRP